MTDGLPSLLQARELFNDIISTRNSSDHPFLDDMELTFREHSLAVAYIAQMIASRSGSLNPEDAYIMGLLHDGGRIIDEFAEKRFHGLVGHYYYNQIDYPQLARISLTHTFYIKDFRLEDYPYPRDDLIRCQQLLKDITYNDYDLLIQLADMINDKGQTCTLEYRVDSLVQRYKFPREKFQPMLDRLNEIKAHFDQKCGTDIYTIFGVK